MPFSYNSESIIESFDLQAMLGEGVSIYVYGAAWNSSTWLSDPTAALVAVNDAFDSVVDLSFSGVQIISSLSNMGTGMAFAVCDVVYKSRTYMDPTDVGTLRTAIANALNTGESGLHLTYGDVVLGSSKSAS